MPLDSSNSTVILDRLCSLTKLFKFITLALLVKES
jgi:hypothetical protein